MWVCPRVYVSTSVNSHGHPYVLLSCLSALSFFPRSRSVLANLPMLC